jgi:hypothetical protein
MLDIALASYSIPSEPTMSSANAQAPEEVHPREPTVTGMRCSS